MGHDRAVHFHPWTSITDLWYYRAGIYNVRTVFQTWPAVSHPTLPDLRVAFAVLPCPDHRFDRAMAAENWENKGISAIYAP
jgi:hypothetical protein